MPYTGPPLPSVSPSTLDEYQSTTFNAILNYMVGDTSVDLDADLVNFLVTKGLMTVDGSGNGSISGAGYEFMLLGERGRIWGLCREYLLGLTGPSLCTAVLMLASMATARKGRGCGIDKIPRDALQHMPVFKRLGMVYFNKGERVWYPTGAATEMGGGEGDVKVDAAAALNLPDPLGSSHLAIIVQTNFSVVAYTTTALHVKMMSLFVDPASFLFLPNMVMGSITRESVKDAMAKGIKASQIVGFLKGNMHPCLRGESFPVPENVEDQIFLWGRELTRVTSKLAHRIQLASDEEYEAVAGYARKIGAMEVGGKEERVIYVEYGRAERIRMFRGKWRLRKQRERGGGGGENAYK
jgi:transcription initiation factor TFIIH subunit 4